MSFLGGGSSSGSVNQAKIANAEAELDMVTDMFNRLTEVCHKKCIMANYSSADLSWKDGSCIDNCVGKYFDVNVKVGEHMQQLGKSGVFNNNSF